MLLSRAAFDPAAPCGQGVAGSQHGGADILARRQADGGDNAAGVFSEMDVGEVHGAAFKQSCEMVAGGLGGFGFAGAVAVKLGGIDAGDTDMDSLVETEPQVDSDHQRVTVYDAQDLGRIRAGQVLGGVRASHGEKGRERGNRYLPPLLSG